MTDRGRAGVPHPQSREDPPLGTLYIRLLLVAILTLGFAARVATVRSPLFDFHSWRQADTATIARNFVQERFNPLYPQVDWRGAQRDGYVETGLELHAFAVAMLAKVFGFSAAIGRLLNAALFPVAAFLLFRFVQLRYGDEAALTGAFIYSVGLPLTMFVDRAFMNEALLALLSIVCLRAAQSYCADGRFRDLALLVAASVLIAAVKPTYLIVWGAVVGLFVERYGTATFVRWELWLAGALTAAAGGAWFWHARNLHELTGLSFGLSNKFLDSDILLSVEYPFKVVRRLVKDILGPATAAFAAAGSVVAVRRGKHAEAFGIVAFVVSLVLVSSGNFHHNYYQLPVAPLGAVLASLGIGAVVAAMSNRYRWQRVRVVWVHCAILWVIAMSTLVRSVSAHNWYELDRSRLRLCEDLQPALTPSDRIVFLNDQSPDVLFCLDRKGWLLNREQSTLSYLQSLVGRGASVVVVRREHEDLREQLEAIAPRIVETPDFVVVRLAAQGPSNR